MRNLVGGEFPGPIGIITKHGPGQTALRLIPVKVFQSVEQFPREQIQPWFDLKHLFVLAD
jgi:hypothetical protein